VSEDITKGKKKGKRGKFSERIVYHVDAGHINDHLTPQHAAAQGHQDVMAADCGKGSTGNPVANVHSPTGSYAEDRVSEPLSAGHAAYSPEDHGVGAGRLADIAIGHPGRNLRQSSTQVSPLAVLSTVNGDNEHHDRDITHAPGSATVARFNAAGEAGSYGGMQMPGGNPLRPDWHQHRDSAVPANPGVPSGQMAAQVPARQSMKSESPLDIMKATMRVYGS
jgi:hypothetical protein